MRMEKMTDQRAEKQMEDQRMQKRTGGRRYG